MEANTRPTTVVYIATSLDGFIARPDGAIDWLGPPEGEDYGWAEFIAAIDAIVMGRVTFEQVVSFGVWRYEGTPLTVLSRSLKNVPDHLKGKAEISTKEPITLLEHLAARGCKRVYVDGGKTVQIFMRADLIDELVITRIPVLIGQGIPLFGPLDGDFFNDTATTESFAAGLVKSSYRRRR
jgi:dihydrofolate reductase